MSFQIYLNNNLAYKGIDSIVTARKIAKRHHLAEIVEVLE